MKKKLLPVIILSFLFIIALSKLVYSQQSWNTKDSLEVKTTFIIDGKKVRITAMAKGLQEDNIKLVAGQTTVKDAIKWFGEKYRHGILIFESIKKEEDNEKK